MKKIKKKNIFQRMACILCAGLLALLPFGSFFGIQQQEKIGANAETFDSGTIHYDAIVNPYSFFEFSIRRPVNDWAGFSDSDFNYYTFSLPKYVTNPAFLRDNGNPTINSVFNYLPLYSGSFRYLLNSTYSNYYYYSSDFPKPLVDFSISTFPNNFKVNTLNLSIDNEVVPLSCFKHWIIKDSNDSFTSKIDVQANMIDARLTISQFVDGDFIDTTFSTGNVFVNLSAVTSYNDYSWHLDDIFSYIGLNLQNISDYTFSSDTNFIYVKELNFVFNYWGDSTFNDFVYYNNVSFDFIPFSSFYNVSYDVYSIFRNDLFSVVRNYELEKFTPIDVIFNTVDSFFNLEIFPGFKISYILYIGVAGLIIGFAIKIFLQG